MGLDSVISIGNGRSGNAQSGVRFSKRLRFHYGMPMPSFKAIVARHEVNRTDVPNKYATWATYSAQNRVSCIFATRILGCRVTLASSKAHGKLVVAKPAKE